MVLSTPKAVDAPGAGVLSGLVTVASPVAGAPTPVAEIAFSTTDSAEAALMSTSFGATLMAVTGVETFGAISKAVTGIAVFGVLRCGGLKRCSRALKYAVTALTGLQVLKLGRLVVMSLVSVGLTIVEAILMSKFGMMAVSSLVRIAACRLYAGQNEAPAPN